MLTASRRATGVTLFTLLAATFFLSGFSALLYQVAWQRMLGLFAGSDVRSVTIVIGAYLAGLGVGSLIGTLIADRLSSRQAVVLFGLCNLGIAAFAFISRLLFYDLLFRQMTALAAAPGLLLLVAFVSLLLPTLLMGLSLPLLARALVRSVSEAPRLIGTLYAVNTFGSAVGTLVAGWFLIGTFGFDRTVYLGGTLSVMVGMVALAIGRRLAADDQEGNVALSFSLRGVPHAVWGWCALVGMAGFVSISLELIWFRLLSMVVEARAYTFAHMLAFILVGYAVGSLLAARFARLINNPRLVFALIQGLVAVYVLLSILAIYQFYDWLAPQLVPLKRSLEAIEPLAGLPPAFWMGYFWVPALLLLPPNILIGFNFTVTQKAVQTDGQLIGQRVGLIQVAGIIGNTAGAILTGMLLLTTPGTPGTLQLIAALAVLIMLAVVGTARRRAFLIVTAIAVVVMAMMFPGSHHFWARLHGSPSDQAIVAEDASGVTVLRRLGQGAVLMSGGSAQGGIPFLTVHALLGSLPALVHADPQRIMVIGIGSAGTPYAAGLNPRTEAVVAVEIVGSQLSVLRAFAAEPGGAPLKALFADVRYRLVVGDGRRELVQSIERFDIVQADAILPWKSHSGLLYSEEFFEEVRDRLSDDGIMAQWIPTPRTAATFMQVFPYGVNVGGFMMLGSNAPIVYDKVALLKHLDDPAIRAYLERGRINPADLAGFIQGTDFTTWTPETPRTGAINSDLWPRDEYHLNNP